MIQRLVHCGSSKVVPKTPGSSANVMELEDDHIIGTVKGFITELPPSTIMFVPVLMAVSDSLDSTTVVKETCHVA